VTSPTVRRGSHWRAAVGRSIVIVPAGFFQICAVVSVPYTWIKLGIPFFAACLIPALVLGLSTRRLWTSLLWWTLSSALGFSLLFAEGEVATYPWALWEASGASFVLFGCFAFCTVLFGFYIRRGESPKRRLLSLAAISVILVATSSVQWLHAERWPKDFSHLSRVQAFDQLHHLVADYYPYLDRKNIDIQSAYDRFKGRVGDSSTELEYARCLAEYMSVLNDGHAHVSHSGLGVRFYCRPPILLEEAEGQVVIEKVLDPQLSQQGVVPGLVLLSIDGTPLPDAKKNVPAFLVSGGTEACKSYRLTHWLLSGAQGTRVTLKCKTLGAKEINFTLTRNSQVRRVDSSLEFRALSDSIGYLRLPSFSLPDTADFFVSKLNEIYACRGLIIDVRGNGGGNEAVAQKINRYLFRDPVRYGQSHSEKLRHLCRRAVIHPAAKTYDGIICILVDGGCFSTCCGFLAPHIKTGRSILIGKPAGGGGGDPSHGRVKMPDDIQVRFPLTAFLDVDGRETQETQGYQPDILVERTIRGISEGRDEILEAALDYLRAELL